MKKKKEKKPFWGEVLQALSSNVSASDTRKERGFGAVKAFHMLIIYCVSVPVPKT